MFLTACGGPPYDIDSEQGRAAMEKQILLDLTVNSCDTATVMATSLYNSKYSDNTIRMLYASAMGCKVGINLYDLIGKLSGFSSSANPLGEFAKIFPSVATDNKLEAAWAGQDALQSILKTGTVLSAANQFYATPMNSAAGQISFNIGSAKFSDHTDDANVYMMFMTMGLIGATFNRYGAPDASYNQGTDLPWETTANVKIDTTGAACGIASAFLNFFDAAAVAQAYLSGGSSGGLAAVTALQSIVVTTDPNPLKPGYGGNNRCLTDGFSQAQCDAAKIRLEYRASCTEFDAIASFAAGVIGAVNDLWQ